MWTTDFADRWQAARVLARGPLYEWPRNETVFRAASKSFWDLDGLKERVGRLEAPTIVIHGAHDEPVRAREVAELAPHGRWVELESSAHVPWLEEPARVREALRTFIAELPD